MSLDEKPENPSYLAHFRYKLARLLWTGADKVGIQTTPCCGLNAWQNVQDTIEEIECLWADEHPDKDPKGWIPIVDEVLGWKVPALYAVLTQHQTWAKEVLEQLGFVAGSVWKNPNSGNTLTMWLRLPKEER